MMPDRWDDLAGGIRSHLRIESPRVVAEVNGTIATALRNAYECGRRESMDEIRVAIRHDSIVLRKLFDQLMGDDGD